MEAETNWWFPIPTTWKLKVGCSWAFICTMSLLVDADVDRNMVLPRPATSVPTAQAEHPDASGACNFSCIYLWEGISCQKRMHWKDLECIFPSEFGVFTEDVEHGRRAIARNWHEWKKRKMQACVLLVECVARYMLNSVHCRFAV